MKRFRLAKKAITLTGTFSLVLLTLLLTACASQTDVPSSLTLPNTSALTPTTTTHTNTTTSTSNNSTASNKTSTPAHPATPIKVIRMINQVGWAITQNAIIRTADYGVTWQDVTPNTITLGPDASGDFMDSDNAWVAFTYNAYQNNTITVEHTSDGGQTWQQYTTSAPDPAVIDPPHFLNNQEGWLEVSINGGLNANGEAVDVLHTLNGGQTWQKVSSPPTAGKKTGISFKDSLNGWATGTDSSNQPWVYVTHNGGQSWQKQNLSNLPGSGSSTVYYKATPPVLFGSYGELPIYIYNGGAKAQGMLLYKTNDSGQTWTTDYATNQAALDPGYPDGLYILNQNYAWSNDSADGTFRMTDNAGQDWINEAQVSLIHGISFIDTSNGFALGQTTLLRTTDGGQHWHVQSYTIQ